MKVFISILAMITMSSCTYKQPEPVCKMLFKAISVSSQAVATALQCENEAAIAADLSAPILKMGMCETTAQSTLSDFVCPQLSQMVATITVTTIPENWKCTATVASDILKQKIADTCVSLVK